MTTGDLCLGTLAGFSSPAVVTVWALFILSAGLTHTGIAHQIGQPLQRYHASQHLQVESPERVQDKLWESLLMAEGRVKEGSPLLGATLAESGLRREYRVHVLIAWFN
ncbi:MAG: hypothetical protein VR65_22165 [Desulfobulbaceae bacterium BRH_c16a]|nr:MAG: hypothetical protein VR65_22165 [Desulfobulbaceae bacterium BRH_c16a]